MSNFILPLAAQLFNEALAILSLLIQLLTLCVKALVWDPYFAAVVFVVLNGRLGSLFGVLCSLYAV